jgi:hypothetical protein
LQRTFGHTTQTSDHTSKPRAIYPEQEAEAVGDVFRRFLSISHLVWGRVVPDLPDFCRDLDAVLAEEYGKGRRNVTPVDTPMVRRWGRGVSEQACLVYVHNPFAMQLVGL